MRAANEGNQWFYILPNGEVFRCNNISGTPLGSPLAGELVETLDPSFHADPSLLYDAVETRDHVVIVDTGLERFDDRDFGNLRFNASIHGRKFHDLNANGTRDVGEQYLNGWTIELVAANGTVLETTITMDEDLNGDGTIDPETERGWYWFMDLEPGEFTVREVEQAGWTQTTVASGPAASGLRT